MPSLQILRAELSKTRCPIRKVPNLTSADFVFSVGAEYASSEITALMWRRNFYCPRTHVGGYKAYILHRDNVVNVALKFVSLILQVIIPWKVSSYSSDWLIIAKMHCWAYFNIKPTLKWHGMDKLWRNLLYFL